MSNYLHEYKVTLHTVGPVHIGSGKELNKKEYLIRNNHIGVIDMASLYQFMYSKGLHNKFEQFFLNEYRMDLYGWLREQRIDSKEIEKCMRYDIEMGDTVLARGTRVQIMEFVKDAYGCPYVPGSSVKGMLRTILLSDAMINDEDVRRYSQDSYLRGLNNGGNRNNLLSREQRNIESKVFNRLNKSSKIEDAVNDILSGLIVSDSAPLDTDDLILCQRLEYHVDGSEKRMNVLRECIRPGTDISFTLTIDEKAFDKTDVDILSAIKNVSENYNNTFRQHFNSGGKGKENTVYLGGGSGFATKTDIYPAFGYERGLQTVTDIFKVTVGKKFDEHKHVRNKALGAAPHILKMTRYKGQLYHMGECTWNF